MEAQPGVDMKGHPKIIAMLNLRLSEEHAAIQQYSVHAAMCGNWGYSRLAAYFSDRAKEEIHHANELMGRILFLEGTPDFVDMTTVKIGENVVDMFLADQEAEIAAIAAFTESIDISVTLKDYGTRNLMEHLLTEEDAHLDVIEANISQITQMGIDNYLPVQMGD